MNGLLRAPQLTSEAHASSSQVDIDTTKNTHTVKAVEPNTPSYGIMEEGDIIESLDRDMLTIRRPECQESETRTMFQRVEYSLGVNVSSSLVDVDEDSHIHVNSNNHLV